MTVPQANIDSPVDLVLTALNEDAIASETRRPSWRSNADSNRSFLRSCKRANVPLSSSPHQAGVADTSTIAASLRCSRATGAIPFSTMIVEAQGLVDNRMRKLVVPIAANSSQSQCLSGSVTQANHF
jgi:hypothetical protein